MLVPPGPTFYDRVIFEGRFEQVILQDDTRSKFAMQKQTTYERETFRHLRFNKPADPPNLPKLNDFDIKSA